MNIFGLSIGELAAQLALGLVNGSFYAMMSLGLAVIFGLLGIVNFAHGAFYMLGAMFSWMALTYFGLPYWPTLFLSPLSVGVIALVVERFGLRFLYSVNPLYGFLFTFGLALVLKGILQLIYGVSGLPYDIPSELQGFVDLGFMMMPLYRIWVITASLFVCGSIWILIEKTRLGGILRAATENAALTQALGHNVPALRSLVYALGAAIAALAGVLAAPTTQVSPIMGDNLIIVVFAVVVVGGMGSIVGSVVSGFLLGMVEALAKIWIPEASSTAIFVVMVLILMVKPAGLFGKEI